jgi:hypothetical protein
MRIEWSGYFVSNVAGKKKHLKQGSEKRKKAKFYCKEHKLYYYKECTLCPQTPQTSLDEYIYKKAKIIKDGEDFGYALE